MQEKLIDIDLFAEGLEPWPNQVFYKNFDAYFLLSYPAYQYNPNEENIFDPFDLLNNLQEKNIYISEPSGKYNLTHAMNEDWNRQIYYDAFQQNINEERFLFWQSDEDRWAMVSDAKYKVAIIGIDWKVANQVPLFFNQCLLSPMQFLEAIGMQQHEKIFLQNYQPAKVLTDGNAKNPIWIKYFFKCHVNNENDKLFYWPQFGKIFNAMYPVLKHCKSIDMYASQAFERRYWMNNQWYSSGKNAPIGGWQKYSYANCQKVAKKFLNDNKHLQLKFEGKQEESEALYVANKKGLIEFYDFWVYASHIRVKQKGSQSDFYFKSSRQIFANRIDKYNQHFNFCYMNGLLKEEDVSNLVKELSKIGFAIKVHKLIKPFTYAVYTKNEPLAINGMYNATIDLESDTNLNSL